MEIKIVNIPSSLSQMTLKDYQAISKIIADGGDNEMLIRNQIVQYYTGCAFKDIDKVVTAQEFNTIIDNVSNCLREQPELKPVFVHEGVHYGFIPTLEKITTGEYIDLDTYITDSQMWHKSMAVLYRPVIEVEKKGWLSKRFGYDIEPYEGSSKYSEQMLTMPADVALGATLFFWTLSIDLLKASLTSIDKMLEKRTKKVSPQQRSNLETTKAGIKASMQQLTENSLIWMPFKTNL